jgi:opacity protein-like surface antigen
VSVKTSAGLFGVDLNDFNKDCSALEDKCDKDDYKDYTGWGLGVNWAPSDVVTVD